ncbi:MAG: hypothetical protein H7839_05905 [Magnetococcus sp. YQC-5]
MFWKYLFPFFLLGGMYWLGKRSTRRNVTPHAPNLAQRHTIMDFQPTSRKAFHATAITIVLVVTGMLAWFVYNDWRAAHQVVEVRVIHVQSGQVTTYEAMKNKVQGRSFLSLDGRRITLADVERMEVTEGP